VLFFLQSLTFSKSNQPKLNAEFQMYLWFAHEGYLSFEQKEKKQKNKWKWLNEKKNET